MVLRHEVRVLKRQLHGRVRYRTADRVILAALSRLLRDGGGVAFSSRPRHCSAGIGSSRDASGNVGEPSEGLDVHHFVMSSSSSSSSRPGEPPLGCVRIQGELRELRIRVSASSIRRVPRRHGLEPAPRSGPTWKEFLVAQASGISATDFFVVDTIKFTQLYVLFVIELQSRVVQSSGSPIIRPAPLSPRLPAT